jgi:hypothetical protein
MRIPFCAAHSRDSYPATHGLKSPPNLYMVKLQPEPEAEINTEIFSCYGLV